MLTNLWAKSLKLIFLRSHFETFLSHLAAKQVLSLKAFDIVTNGIGCKQSNRNVVLKPCPISADASWPPVDRMNSFWIGNYVNAS